MSHYGIEGGKVVAERDFRNFWKTTNACKRDGCYEVHVFPFHIGNYSKTVEERFFKKMEDRDGVKSYSVNAYDLGIDHYEVVVKKNKVVNHHIQTVEEIHSYKKKPTRIVKGGVLKEMHVFIIDFDAREYDPLEHEGYVL